jgi:hypothetical protein
MSRVSHRSVRLLKRKKIGGQGADRSSVLSHGATRLPALISLRHEPTLAKPLPTIGHSMSASSQRVPRINPESDAIPRLVNGSGTTPDNDCEVLRTFSHKDSFKDICAVATECILVNGYEKS